MDMARSRLVALALLVGAAWVACDDTGAVVAAPDAATLDLCPADPAKNLPGICGCGVPDVDEDQNGIPDCFECRPFGDECPRGTWCAPTRNDTSFLFRCVPAGPHGEGEPCEISDDCGEGLACSVFLRRCAQTCGAPLVWTYCPKGLECLDSESSAHPDTRGFPVCVEPCDPKGEPSCSEGLACSPARSFGASNGACFAVPDPLPELGEPCPVEFVSCGDNRACFPIGPDCPSGHCCTERCSSSDPDEWIELDHPDCPASLPHCANFPRFDDDGFCVADDYDLVGS
jgi:hypothetical protein